MTCVCLQQPGILLEFVGVEREENVLTFVFLRILFVFFLNNASAMYVNVNDRYRFGQHCTTMSLKISQKPFVVMKYKLMNSMVERKKYNDVLTESPE
jgi:hypothetical protein